MGWRDIVGKLLMKIGDSLPAPAAPVFADPFNYTLASLLQDSRQAPTALQAAAQKEFPSLTPTAHAALRHQLDEAYTLATELASAVNKQQLSQHAAGERLKQAFPQMAQANAGSLLLQQLIGTR